MRTVSRLRDVPANALAAFAQPDGTWLVYEPGDTLPAVREPTPEELAAEAKAVAEKARTDEEAVAIMKDPKLLAIAKMTPTEVRAWVQTSVKDLAQTHDALATLAVAVSVLSRRAL